ncbi:hypothetical protein [Tardiphaga sp. 709]|uniref:hypothetical protein n=1 Tax=Tardiphaga sp. 709 TaxID=3076039 RepID=UPI0028EADCD4|nr:hypothetical protein [Tardiphaga sp. 709]WNV09988.1 hypothetical protein RSO67_01965 [Tardiphaga sp. 709]
MDDNYATNLIRSVSAQLYMQNVMQLSQEMLGKSYSSLSQPERSLVDRAAYDLLAHFYSVLTPEFFVGQQTAASVGFGTTHPDRPAQPQPSQPDAPKAPG